MIRAFDRLYRRRPRLTATLMIILCAVILWEADRADRENTSMLRLQWAATIRSAT